MANSVKVLVVFYSMYGNVAKLAKAVAQGAGSVEGVEVSLKQVPELIPKEVIEANERLKKVKEELSSIPTAQPEDLAEADGIVFGTPTRYGNMSAQMKQFIDRTGSLWEKGALENKVAGVFTSTSTLHGGQETTIITSMMPLFHLGMIIVGVPYSEQRLFSLETGGGSPYGASSVSGPMADRPPTENDLEIAKTLGRRVAEIAKKIKG
ncbi:NAD(P)H:quinone oxidoreductase [Candidatus Hecatella orcuttiae]|uniref:NAD(P)H:quinone oxidoreductase n=1 Tax=Candidatus Hecatella orcuttiae TaxID=1935119 RepID=UPI0028683719|nr:NAD(P)H:quinone oxidoreductase [Candidatus Hecatella orcuttiae]